MLGRRRERPRDRRDPSLYLLENYTFLTLRFSMQGTNIYPVAKELLLKGFSNIGKNALLKSGGESDQTISG